MSKMKQSKTSSSRYQFGNTIKKTLCFYFNFNNYFYYFKCCSKMQLVKDYSDQVGVLARAARREEDSGFGEVVHVCHCQTINVDRKSAICQKRSFLFSRTVTKQNQNLTAKPNQTKQVWPPKPNQNKTSIPIQRKPFSTKSNQNKFYKRKLNQTKPNQTKTIQIQTKQKSTKPNQTGFNEVS